MDISAIQKRISRLEEYARENRELKGMIKDELENELAYVEVMEEAKALAMKKRDIKDDIIGRGPNEEIMKKIAENTEEIDTLKDILSAELIELYTERKTDEIADESGASRKFKINVKLLPKGAKNQNRDGFGKYTEDNKD